MICTNAKCKRVVDNPLELYDGRWACPHCKKELVGTVTTFRITPASEELFLLSEKCYYTYLTMSGYDRVTSGAATLQKAVELCKDAAGQGNPLAVTRLGYYFDKDFVDVNRTEAMRCRMAYTYYAQVCFCDTELQCVGVDDAKYDWKEIRMQAATLLMQMLAAVPDTLARTEYFDYDVNRARVQRMLGMDVPRRGGEGKAVARVERVYRTLGECCSKTRAPLFGILRINGGELKTLFAMAPDDTPDVFRLVEKGLVLSIAECDARGGLNASYAALYALSNRRRIEKELDELSDTQELYLFFFNPMGAHKFLSKRDRSAVRSALQANKDDLICRLIGNGGRTDYTFFDDDVYMYKVALRPVKDAVKKLVTVVCQGEET